MKYKVGDKVKIRADLEVGRAYNSCNFITDMKRYEGEIATITYCYDDDSYDIDLDGGAWFWTDDMLEDITESESEDEQTVDVGYHLRYCGHRVLKDVLQGDTGVNRIYYTKNYAIQYIIPIDAIDFIVPHED